MICVYSVKYVVTYFLMCMCYPLENELLIQNGYLFPFIVEFHVSFNAYFLYSIKYSKTARTQFYCRRLRLNES